MSSIHLLKRKRKTKHGTIYFDKYYTAEIRFGRQAVFRRSTGQAHKKQALKRAKEIVKMLEIERSDSPEQAILDARNLLKKLEHQHNPNILTLEKMFGGHIDEHLYKKPSCDRSMIAMEHILRIADPKMPITDINAPLLSRYIRTRHKEEVSDATIDKELGTLKAAINFAKKRWKAEIPTIIWEDFKGEATNERIILETPESIEKMFTPLPIHIWRAAAFCLYVGCRLSEMKNLQWSRVKMQHKIFVVKIKGGKEKIFDLPDAALCILEDIALQDTKSPTPETVFDLRNRRKEWHKARKLTNRLDFTWHDIRHVTATWMTQYGKSDISLIQNVLKHTDARTTRRYIHVGNEDLRAALNKIPQISKSTTTKQIVAIQDAIHP